MTDHAAASAAERERAPDPDTDAAPAPKLLMFGAPDAPACDGDGCVVPFAANLPTPTREHTEGSPE